MNSARASGPDPWLGQDKAQHFAVTATLAADGYWLLATKLPARGTTLLFAAAPPLLLGAAKETWDLMGHGDPSWKDVTWDVLGTVSGLALAWTVDLAIHGVDEAHPLFRAPALSF